MRRKLAFITAIVLFMTGCLGTVHDGEDSVSISLSEQLSFMSGETMRQNAQPSSQTTSPLGRVVSYRQYIDEHPELGDLARLAVLYMLDAVEISVSAQDDYEREIRLSELEAEVLADTEMEDAMKLSVCKVIAQLEGGYSDSLVNEPFKAIELLLKDDKTRRDENLKTMQYVQQAAGDAAMADREKVLELSDKIDTLGEYLNNRQKAAAAALALHSSMPSFGTSEYAVEDDARAAELEYCLSTTFSTVALSVQYNVGRHSVSMFYDDLITSISDKSEYSRNMSRVWLKTAYDSLTLNEVPGVKKELEKLIKDYDKTLEDTIALLSLNLFLSDRSKCECHLDTYHFYEGLFAFPDTAGMQEDLRNKLASYGDTNDLVRYEDDNLINMLMYTEYEADAYESLYFWRGLRDDDLKKELMDLFNANPVNIFDISGTNETMNEHILDFQIKRSAATLLPPVIMAYPEYMGRLNKTDESATPYSFGYDWNRIRGFFNGNTISRDKFGNTVGGQKIMDYYKGTSVLGLLYYDRKSITFSQLLDTLMKEYQPRKAPVYGPNELCRKHLLSYHTIEPELVEHIESNGRSLTEFTNACAGDTELYNIRHFVSFYNITQGAFELIFPGNRAFEPYNIAAVYGNEDEAKYYFDLSYKPGYEVSYNMNGVSAARPASRNIPPGKMYTLASAPVAEGFIFLNWNTLRSGGGTSYAALSTAVMDPPQATVYYAQWQKKEFNLTYDLNGSADTPLEPTTHLFGENVYAMSADGITPPPGMRFVQWNTMPDGTGTFYNEGDIISIQANDLTLYAIWEELSYTITYDINGGKNTAPTQDPVKMGDSFVAASGDTIGKPTLRMFFVGWNTEADDTGVYYKPGETITPDRDMVLYAIWYERIRITYDASDIKDAERKTREYEYIPRDTITLLSNLNSFNIALTTKYILKGWDTSPTLDGERYAPGAEYTVPINDVTLYPVYEISDMYKE